VQAGIEHEVDQRFDVSSLVTPIGGLGAYPTMLPETSVLGWVLSTAAHEWVHNYLLFMLSPVGLNYDGDPALRTINETTAVIVEREIEARVAERYYPDLSAALATDISASANAEGVSGDAPMNCSPRARSPRPKPTWRRVAGGSWRMATPFAS
jgi:hypothetical protein